MTWHSLEDQGSWCGFARTWSSMPPSGSARSAASCPGRPPDSTGKYGARPGQRGPWHPPRRQPSRHACSRRDTRDADERRAASGIATRQRQQQSQRRSAQADSRRGRQQRERGRKAVKLHRTLVHRQEGQIDKSRRRRRSTGKHSRSRASDWLAAAVRAGSVSRHGAVVEALIDVTSVGRRSTASRQRESVATTYRPPQKPLELEVKAPVRGLKVQVYLRPVFLAA